MIINYIAITILIFVEFYFIIEIISAELFIVKKKKRVLNDVVDARHLDITSVSTNLEKIQKDLLKIDEIKSKRDNYRKILKLYIDNLFEINSTYFMKKEQFYFEEEKEIIGEFLTYKEQHMSKHLRLNILSVSQVLLYIYSFLIMRKYFEIFGNPNKLIDTFFTPKGNSLTFREEYDKAGNKSYPILNFLNLIFFSFKLEKNQKHIPSPQMRSINPIFEDSFNRFYFTKKDRDSKTGESIFITVPKMDSFKNIEIKDSNKIFDLADLQIKGIQVHMETDDTKYQALKVNNFMKHKHTYDSLIKDHLNKVVLSYNQVLSLSDKNPFDKIVSTLSDTKNEFIIFLNKEQVGTIDESQEQHDLDENNMNTDVDDIYEQDEKYSSSDEDDYLNNYNESDTYIKTEDTSPDDMFGSFYKKIQLKGFLGKFKNIPNQDMYVYDATISDYQESLIEFFETIDYFKKVYFSSEKILLALNNLDENNLFIGIEQQDIDSGLTNYIKEVKEKAEKFNKSFFLSYKKTNVFLIPLSYEMFNQNYLIFADDFYSKLKNNISSIIDIFETIEDKDFYFMPMFFIDNFVKYLKNINMEQDFDAYLKLKEGIPKDVLKEFSKEIDILIKSYKEE